MGVVPAPPTVAGDADSGEAADDVVSAVPLSVLDVSVVAVPGVAVALVDVAETSRSRTVVTVDGVAVAVESVTPAPDVVSVPTVPGVEDAPTVGVWVMAVSLVDVPGVADAEVINTLAATPSPTKVVPGVAVAAEVAARVFVILDTAPVPGLVDADTEAPDVTCVSVEAVAGVPEALDT